MEHVKNTLIKLAREALALEVEEAEPVGTLGFMARSLIQATMPDSKSDTPYFQRRLRLVERKGMANLKPSAPGDKQEAAHRAVTEPLWQPSEHPTAPAARLVLTAHPASRK